LCQSPVFLARGVWRGLTVPSLELDDELAHYASVNATRANVIIDYEFESLGPMYGFIRQELPHVTTSILPWAVQLSNLYDTISNLGGFLESDLVVLTETLNQGLSDYVGPNVELVVSPLNNAVAPAIELTCLQLPTPDALTRLGGFGGHIQRGNLRILRARAYLDLLAFCIPSPPDYMRVISGTSREFLALFFASHESIFKVPSDCYTMAAHIVLTSPRSAPLMLSSPHAAKRLPPSLVGPDLSRRSRAYLCRVSAPQLLCV
jgi:hypothetical protein